MKRTQIQVPEDRYEELERIAHQEGRSVADLVREGIELVLRQNRALAASLDAIAGKFRPLPMEDLKAHDRWLAEAAGQRRTARKRR